MAIFSVPIENPITSALFNTKSIYHIKNQAVSTYNFILHRWTPKTWLSKAFLILLKLCIKLTSKAVNIGVKYSGILLLVKLLYRHLKVLVTLLSAQIIWTTFISHYYFKIMYFLHGLLHPAQKQKREELTVKVENATTYAEWAQSISQLDELDGLTAWKEDNSSPHYDYHRLERFCSILLHLYITENTQAMMLLFSSHLTRNFCGILHPDLYTVLGVGTKQLIEDYIQLVINSLDLIAQDETIPIAERLSFFSKLRHVFGRSGLLLSGGATLSLMHAGVMVELVRSGLCPMVISGSSGGSILGCLLAARTDKEFLDIILKRPEALYTYMYYPEKMTDVHRQLFGPLPVFERRPRRTLFDVRFLQYAIRQIIPPNATFLDLYHHSGGRIFNVVIHSNTLGNGFFVANYLTAPHVYVSSAVAASCALPGVFEPLPILYSRTYTKLTLSYLRGKLGTLVQKQLAAADGDDNDHDYSNNNDDATTTPTTNTTNTSSNNASGLSSPTITLIGSTPQQHINPQITQNSAPISQISTSTQPSQQQPPSKLLLNPKSIDPSIIHESLGPIVNAGGNNNSTNNNNNTAPHSRNNTIGGTQQHKANMSQFDNELTEQEHASITSLFGDTRLYEDGSLGADLPFNVLREQFGVNFSIVSQVNPHVAPILRCFPSFDPNYYATRRRPYTIGIVGSIMNLSLHIIEYLLTSFRSLVLNLTEAKLLPWFPATLRSMLSQTYSGDMTILPPKLGWEAFKTAFANPTGRLLEQHRDGSIRHTWRYLTRVKIATKIENTLQKISYNLRVRYQNSHLVGGGGTNSHGFGPVNNPTNNTNKAIGISSLGSSSNLNAIGMVHHTPIMNTTSLSQSEGHTPKTPTLCRIQSSTVDKTHHNNNNNNMMPSPHFNTSTLKPSNSTTSIGNSNSSNDGQIKTRTLTRRSSFFQQIYMNNLDENTTPNTSSHPNHQQVITNPNVTPEDFRNVNDADDADYYDVDCYLYERDENGSNNDDDKENITNSGDGSGDGIALVGKTITSVDSEPNKEDVKLTTLDHELHKDESLLDTNTSLNIGMSNNTNTHNPNISPHQLSGSVSFTNGVVNQDNLTNPQHHIKTPLRSKHSSSFYRIKSSFVDNINHNYDYSLDGLDHPTNTINNSNISHHSNNNQSHGQSPQSNQPNTPSKYTSSVLLPVHNQNNITNQPYLHHDNSFQHHQHYQQSHNFNSQNNQTGIILANIPRNLSHDSSVSGMSMNNQQLNSDSQNAHISSQQQQQQHQGFNPYNPTYNPSQPPPMYGNIQLYRSPSDESTTRYGEFYPSQGELGFDSF